MYVAQQRIYLTKKEGTFFSLLGCYQSGNVPTQGNRLNTLKKAALPKRQYVTTLKKTASASQFQSLHYVTTLRRIFYLQFLSLLHQFMVQCVDLFVFLFYVTGECYTEDEPRQVAETAQYGLELIFKSSLRWLKIVYSTFQDLAFADLLLLLYTDWLMPQSWYQIFPVIDELVGVNFLAPQATMATMRLVTNTLNST